MTKEKLLNQEYQITAEIPLAFMRYLETRTDERVLEVVLVYNGVDRFDTVINPEGMRTDPNVVTVDYNHKGVNTGAYLRNVRVVDNYTLEDGTVLERALIGDIHIPKDSEMFYTTREGEKKSNGNLYEAVTKGQVRSVSVEFKPYLGKQITDTKTGITTYNEWDLLRLSLLDVTPGQPYSGIKITRSLINNNMSITIENIKSAVEAGELNKEELRALLEEPKAEENPADQTQRDIMVEADGNKPDDEGDQPSAENPDTNGDGEISDEEIRSYVKEIKRAYADPKMIKERMDTLERMCDETKKRMDEMTKQPEQRDLTEQEKEEIEAQEIEKRALNSNLSDEIPDKKESIAGDAQRSLGLEGDKEGESEEDKKEKENALQLRNYRRAKGFTKLY